ncbi:MAG: tellurite resistance TerB family protein [Cyanobium sp.]
MTPAEAFAALALVAVACDGSLDREEAHSLRQQLQDRTPYRQLSEESMGAMFDALLADLRRQGWRGLLEKALPQLTAEQQETGLAMAAQLVHCDRIVREEEQQMLTFLAQNSALPAERSAQILEVIALLNRDSLAT